MISDAVTLEGQIRAVVFEGEIGEAAALAYLNGEPTSYPVVSDQTWKNLVTNIGRQQMTKLIVAETTALCRYMGLSTSAPTLLITDTALPNEIYRQGNSIAQSVLTTSTTAQQRYSSYFTTAVFGSTGIAGEGLFDVASTGGNMWAEAAISVSKSTTQGLIVEHRIGATTG